MFLQCLLVVLLAICLTVTILLIDKAISNKRLEENQIAWNEYSKEMTFDEKLEHYIEWCERRKVEKGWENYYFPRM